ncbi:MAG TPA: hypothetical protein VG897_11210 [Terriglobales bacterium]|nr:hypothetical protein [Terriglobales bacterium]
MPPSASPQGAPPQQQATPAPGTGVAGETNPQDQARETIERVSTDLNLTPDQKSKLQPILASEIQLVHSLRTDTSMTPEQKQAKFKDQLTADHAKIDTILTPEQKQKLALMNQQRQQQEQTQQAPPQAAPQASPQTSPQATPKP